MFKVTGHVGTPYEGKEWTVYQVLVVDRIINFLIYFEGHWKYAGAKNFVPNEFIDELMG
jgi:hypothetical protein